MQNTGYEGVLLTARILSKSDAQLAVQNHPLHVEPGNISDDYKKNSNRKSSSSDPPCIDTRWQNSPCLVVGLYTAQAHRLPAIVSHSLRFCVLDTGQVALPLWESEQSVVVCILNGGRCSRSCSSTDMLVILI